MNTNNEIRRTVLNALALSSAAYLDGFLATSTGAIEFVTAGEHGCAMGRVAEALNRAHPDTFLEVVRGARRDIAAEPCGFESRFPMRYRVVGRNGRAL